MSEKSLREFANEIRQEIDEGRTDEAILRAQYLLRHFPRYLQAYCLLAEAALDQGITDDAGEVLRRVLSADPESFVAHTGLSLVYSEQGSLDEALWHMLRAFELEPGMREIREQLRQLYQQRDGQVPNRLELNRAALARTYLRDGLHDRAAKEFAAELAGQPDRLDLRVALAEAQWHAGQRVQAVQSAQAILQALPYCIKANLIVGQFYAVEGDPDSALPYFSMVEELDPEHEQALSLFGETSYLKMVRVTLPAMEPDARTVRPEGQAEPAPLWLADLPLFAAQPEEQELDWDAIIAYQSDWRTQLAEGTRDAIDDFKPNWRIELRRVTQHQLAERPTNPPAAPTPVRPPRPAPRGPSQPSPATGWQQSLRAAADAVLPKPSGNGKHRGQPSASLLHEEWAEERQPVLAGNQALYATATPARAETRPVQRGSRWDPPPTNGAARHPMETAPLWRPSLYFATLSALSQYDRARLARPASPKPKASAPVLWQTAPTPQSFAPVPLQRPLLQVYQPPSTSPLVWMRPLRAATDTELAHWTPPLPAKEWVQALHTNTASSLALWQPPTVPSAQEAALLAPEPDASSASWLGPLRDATEAALREQPTGDEPSGIIARVAEAASNATSQAREIADTLTETAIVQRAKEMADTLVSSDPLHRAKDVADALSESEVVHRAKDMADTILQKASDTLSSFLHRDEPTPEAQAEPATDIQPAEPAPEPIEAEAQAPEPPAGDLARARAAWQGIQPKEAFTIYQGLFTEKDVPDQALIDALTEWTATPDAPASAFHLLGDLHRRQGRMQQAAACYREAINRM